MLSIAHHCIYKVMYLDYLIASAYIYAILGFSTTLATYLWKTVLFDYIIIYSILSKTMSFNYIITHACNIMCSGCIVAYGYI